MKWGKKKHCSSSSPSSTTLFPMSSWLSKFKKTGDSFAPIKEEVANRKQKGKKGSLSASLPSPTSWKEGRFYCGDDDPYLTLSFRKNKFKVEKTEGGLKSIWYNSDEELDDPLSIATITREKKKSSNKGSRRRKEQKFHESVEISLRNHEFKGEKEEFEKEENFVNSIEEQIIQKEKENKKAGDARLPIQRNSSFSSSNLTTIEEESVFEALNLEESSEFSEKGLKLKPLKLRKSVYINKDSLRKRRKRGGKFEHKIKSLEEMKKTRINIEKEKIGFDNFAVVRISVDPEKDFRDSMVDMIPIGKPEELEELLACYLTLNCDEHHDLIIRVFWQVWLDLNQVQLHEKFQFEHCCNYY